MLAAAQPTQVLAGSGLGPDLKLRVPYLIVRRRGKSAQFVTLFQPRSMQASTLSVAATSTEITIRSAAWQDTLSLSETPAYHRQMLH